ncbi:MAG TPA: SDR family oxidoreductase [Chthoniobacterales bacterium]
MAILQGDISHPYLGLDRGTYAGLKAGTTEVLHCAADTGLAFPWNVRGQLTPKDPKPI